MLVGCALPDVYIHFAHACTRIYGLCVDFECQTISIFIFSNQLYISRVVS